MNIFVLDYDIQKCAEYHNDRHVIKMILESAQMLSTTVRLSGIDIGYKSTHVNHPCSKWCRESLSNWRWLKSLSKCLNGQYKIRFDHKINHKSYDVILSLPEPNIKDIGLTKFALAMPEEYKNDDTVISYRQYYICDKQHIATWKHKQKPYWYK